VSEQIGECEFGKCPICGKETFLIRKYYHYRIPCECHSPDHFEIAWHCKDCEPIEPRETRITMEIDKLKELDNLRAKLEAEQAANGELTARLKALEEFAKAAKLISKQIHGGLDIGDKSYIMVPVKVIDAFNQAITKLDLEETETALLKGSGKKPKGIFAEPEGVGNDVSR
jgi:hypothetical protein